MPISHIENADFLAEVRQMNVSMLVVDEARCISEWFRSFHPAYLLLGDIARQLDSPTLLTDDKSRSMHDRVALQEFGAGVVQGVHGDTVTVLFEIVGYTALATTLSLERGLLEVLGDAAMSVAS